MSIYIGKRETKRPCDVLLMKERIAEKESENESDS